MGRKIGDYVHLHYNNYQRFGINQDMEEGSSNFPVYSVWTTKFLNEVPNIKIETILPDDGKKVSKILELTRGKSKGNRRVQQMNNKIFKTIINNYKINDKKLDEYFKQIFNDSFDPETYNVRLRKISTKMLAIQKKENSKFVYASTLVNRIKNLNNNFQEIIVNKVEGKDTEKGAKELTEVYKNIYNRFKEFCIVLGLKFDENNNILNLNKLEKKYKTFKYKDNDGIAVMMPKIDTETEKTEYSLAQVVEIINSYIFFNNLNENLLKGGIFEIYLAIVFHSLIKTKEEEVTDEALKKIIKSFNNNRESKVVGDKGSKNEIVISKFNFSQDIVNKNPDFFKKNFPKMQLILEGEDDTPKVQTLLDVQDKIDVQAEFEITMEDKTSKTINANISAKNVNMKQNIHIVSNTSLLTFFNYSSNYSEYFTHVMNVFASQKDGDERNEVIKPQKKENFQKCLTSLRSFILAQALTGMKEEKVNIFAVNNNQKGTITFMSAYGILKFLNENEYKQSDIRINEKTELINYVLANNKVEDKNKGTSLRIDNMLAQLHNDKITASIYPSAINQISKNNNYKNFVKTFSYPQES